MRRPRRPLPGAEMYRCTRRKCPILTQLTGFQLTRGMLCAMLRPRQPEPKEILAACRRVAVLENVMNPTNVRGRSPQRGCSGHGRGAADRRRQQTPSTAGSARVSVGNVLLRCPGPTCRRDTDMAGNPAPVRAPPPPPWP